MRSAPSCVPHDTAPEAHRAQIEAYRRMGGNGRSQVAFRLNDLARRMAMAGIRERHPDYDEDRVRRALFRLILGADLARRMWPDREPVDP